MLVIYAIAGAIQLAAAVGMYTICKRGLPQALVTIFCGVFLLLFAMPIFVGAGTFFHALALFALALAMLAAKASVRTYLIGGFIMTALVAMFVGITNIAHWNRLAEQYPVVSLSQRLAYESPDRHRQDSPNTIRNESSTRLSDELAILEGNYQRNNWRAESRRRALQQVHSSTVEKFVNSPGFGIGRMLRPIDVLEHADKKGPPVPQPSVASADVSADEKLAEASPTDVSRTTSELQPIHRSAQAEFVSQRSTPYVKDLDHVAGFESHAFTQNESLHDFELEKALQGRLIRLELVSLLKHTPPRVYVSKNLPNMDELRDAPTRPLNPFELRALDKLRQNPSELVAESIDGRIRMLGSVLAVQQCLECHRVNEGELLGAFSYELQPAETLAPAPNQPAPVVF